jgi:tetratricopeptide (TPR) repeat protein
MESPFEYNEADLKALVKRFEQMLKTNEQYFFDVEEFEEIIDFYLDNQVLSKAKKALDIALAQHPGSSLFLLKQARFFMLSNNSHKALDVLEKMQQLDPVNHEVFLTRGSVFLKMKKIKEAETEFRLAMKYADEKEEICAGIAFEFENAGLYSEALKYLHKALEINPKNEGVIFETYFCYEVSENLEGAVDFFTKFLDKHPYSKLCWFNLGIAYNNLELYEKAIESYEFVIAIDDTFSSAYFNLGNSYSNLGEYKLAIKNYKATFETEEAQAVTHYYIGECYEKLHQYDMAIQSYQQALELDDEFPDAWMGLGVCHEEIGQRDVAMDFMKKALELDEDNTEFWYIYGDLCFKSEDKEEALKAYHRVSQTDAMHPDIWLDLSELYDELGDPEMACDTLEEGILHQPKLALHFYRKAAYLLKLGREIQALSYLSVGLEMDPTKLAEFLEFAPPGYQSEKINVLIEKYTGHKP